MTYNELVDAMAQRASALANISMYELRMIVGTDESARVREQECTGMSKGDMVEHVLLEEFSEEFDKDWEI